MVNLSRLLACLLPIVGAEEAYGEIRGEWDLPFNTLAATCASGFTSVDAGATNPNTLIGGLKLKTDNEGDCCALCVTHGPECVAWTWHGKAGTTQKGTPCYLSSTVNIHDQGDKGLISGTRSAKPTPAPAPKPGPTPPAPIPVNPPLGYQPNMFVFSLHFYFNYLTLLFSVFSC